MANVEFISWGWVSFQHFVILMLLCKFCWILIKISHFRWVWHPEVSHGSTTDLKQKKILCIWFWKWYIYPSKYYMYDKYENILIRKLKAFQSSESKMHEHELLWRIEVIVLLNAIDVFKALDIITHECRRTNIYIIYTYLQPVVTMALADVLYFVVVLL